MMYTAEERDTFCFCVQAVLSQRSGRRAMSALTNAVEKAKDGRGVTAGKVTAKLISRLAQSGAPDIEKLLGELAREAREHGVPIAVSEDPNGTLRYWLSLDQVNLIHSQLGRTSAPRRS